MSITVKRDFWYYTFKGLYWVADKTHSNLFGKWAMKAARNTAKVCTIPLSCDKAVR